MFPTTLVVAMLLAVAVSVRAQQPTKIPRIGSLFAAPPSAVSARLEQFRQGLREIGYVEGKNLIIMEGAKYTPIEGQGDTFSIREGMAKTFNLL